MTHPLTLYVLALIFANVLVTQLGLPIPAMPAMIAAGALGAGEEFSVVASLVLAVTAAVIADSIWYVAGRMYGGRVLESLGRVSSQLEVRVQQTNACFDRWGPLALAVAKFVPGFSTIAPALAGSGGIRYLRFLLFDTLGAACWAGTAIAIGMSLGAESDKSEFLRPLSSVTRAGLVTGGPWDILGARRNAPQLRTNATLESRAWSQLTFSAAFTPSLRHDEEETRAINLAAFEMAYSASK